MIDYNKIKHSISPIEAAERYGTVKRGFMRCPFHADRTPSLKLYGDHFHCFGCGAHGDVITSRRDCSVARRLRLQGGSKLTSAMAALCRHWDLQRANANCPAAGTPSRQSRRATQSQTATPRRVRSMHGRATCWMWARAGTRRGWSSRKPHD